MAKTKQNSNKVTFGSELNAELQGVPDQNSLLIADEDYVINTEWMALLHESLSWLKYLKIDMVLIE